MCEGLDAKARFLRCILQGITADYFARDDAVFMLLLCLSRDQVCPWCAWRGRGGVKFLNLVFLLVVVERSFLGNTIGRSPDALPLWAILVAGGSTGILTWVNPSFCVDVAVCC